MYKNRYSNRKKKLRIRTNLLQILKFKISNPNLKVKSKTQNLGLKVKSQNSKLKTNLSKIINPKLQFILNLVTYNPQYVKTSKK